MRIVILDTGPLGLVTNPKATLVNDACRSWLRSLLAAGAQVIVPEIADYELRRELLRGRKAAGLRRLDAVKTVAGIRYLPLTTATMVRAAELWATARQEGRPTARSKELDGDVILSAQAEAVENPGDEVVVATTNVGHLGRFVNAARWQDIPSSR